VQSSLDPVNRAQLRQNSDSWAHCSGRCYDPAIMSASHKQLPSPTAKGAQASAAAKVFELTIKIATSWLGALSAYSAAVVLAVAAYRTMPDKLGLSATLCAAIVLAPLIAAFAFHALPTIREERRRKWLTSVPLFEKPGYFQLAPREDEETFGRADGKHDEILNWLRRPPSGLLYLAGSSGTGKSSLLAAWVLPKLKREGTAIIRLRGYQDPARSLEEELKRPGVIWKRTRPEAKDLNELFEEARQRLLPARLLVVFEQFEEFLILQEKQQQARFLHFLTTQASQAYSSATILLVFRTEYDGFIQDLRLPAPIPGRTLQKVTAFTETAALRFLLGSGLGFNEHLQADVLREAAELEGTKGLIRPVTLNLCGLVLSRFATTLPREYRPGRLIRGFVRESIFQKEISETATILLPKLISPQVTNQPQSIEDMAKGTELSPRQIQGVMFRLGEPERSIVRPLNDECTYWQISHDFLVPLIDTILAPLKERIWKRVRPWLPLACAAAMVCIFLLGRTLYLDPIGELSRLGWKIESQRDPGTQHLDSYTLTYQCRFPTGSVYDSTLTVSNSIPPPESARLLSRISVPFTVILNDPPQFDSANFGDWGSATKLTELDLRFGGHVRPWRGFDISAMRGLGHLSSLDLSFSPVLDGNLKDLPASLVSLNLSEDRITDAGLKDLPRSLKSLDLRRSNIRGTSFKDLPQSLTYLNLRETDVTDAVLKDLPKSLQTLNILGTDVTEEGLAVLPKSVTLVTDPRSGRVVGRWVSVD
jgi:hypothetical protein